MITSFPPSFKSWLEILNQYAVMELQWNYAEQYKFLKWLKGTWNEGRKIGNIIWALVIWTQLGLAPNTWNDGPLNYIKFYSGCLQQNGLRNGAVVSLLWYIFLDFIWMHLLCSTEKKINTILFVDSNMHLFIFHF